MVEQSSVNAMCKELEVRFDLGSEFKIFPPSVCTALTLEQGEDDIGGEMTIFRDEVAKAKHVFFIVWAEHPRHYTYLYTRRPEDQGCRRVASCRHVPCRTSFCYVSVRAVPDFPTCRYVSCRNFIRVGTCQNQFLVVRVMHAGLEPADTCDQKRLPTRTGT